MRRQVFAALLLALGGSLGSVPAAASPAALPAISATATAASAPDSSIPATVPAAYVPASSTAASAPTSGMRSLVRSPDYPPAAWVPAARTNYSSFDRPADFQVNMIVIHDIEGSAASAITTFQDPNRHGSSHYVVSNTGAMTQMVLEKDVAWHAGNWDYNTRAIGIEHAGYAAVNYYTTAEYSASAHIAASICSRWGVPMDRTHVIGHAQVPDPNNPGLGGGDDNHWDPGPHWNWTYYMGLARTYASTLPSPPHMGPNPTAVSAEGGVMLSWQPAQTCTAPITGYSIVGQPGNITLSVPASIHSVWIPGLTDGTGYSFTVTATNVQGESSLTSNTAVPGRKCTAAVISTPTSPQPAGASIRFTATSTSCNSPQYSFWVKPRGGYWTQERYYGGSSWTLDTTGFAPGIYQAAVWARQRGSGNAYEAYGFTTFTLTKSGCLTASMSPNVAPPQTRGADVTFMASSTGCSLPQYQFWLLRPGGSWAVVQAYSASTSWVFNSGSYPSGNFQMGVRVRQTGSGVAYDSYFISSYSIHAAGGCVVSALNSSAASPLVAGSSVTFTPQQSGCTNQYKFWLLRPGGSWSVVQAYGVGSTWVWNTTGYREGIYQVGVWEGRSTTPDVYESYATTTFGLRASTCGSASLSASAVPPQMPGGTINFRASSNGCTNPKYEFWLLPPGGQWTLVKPYGTATWSWSTAGLALGTYQVGAWVRQTGSTAEYDAYFIGSFQLTVPVCSSATIAANLSSPQAAGTHITFTATSAGCSSPRYQFWQQLPGGSWKVVQSYGTGATFVWDSTGAPVSDYNFAVWAVATGSLNAYDAYSSTTSSINS